MKTFEERYTAWIDGQLTGNALTAFEQELARRAEAGDAEAAETDKAAALQLRGLLKEHLQAPTLTNTEFFSHQMRGRIDAEIDKAAARREAAARPAWRFPAYAWPFVRFAGAGVLCLFVAGALYYGMVPAHQQTGQDVVSGKLVSPLTSADQVVKTDASTQPSSALSGERPPGNAYVKLDTPTPTPVDINDDIQVAPAAGTNASATSLHVGNADVLWLNNPPYLPNAVGAAPSPVPAPDTTPATTASVTPSAAP